MDLRAPFHRLNREQRGQTILVFALMFVTLIGFTAIVLDAGIVYWNRRLLQNAVDAAALAGAEKLPGDPNSAVAAAVTYAQDNGVASGELICDPNDTYPPGLLSCQAGSDATYGIRVTQTYSPNDTMVVSARRNIGFGLRYIIGAGDTPVVATASAIAAVTSPSKVAPWAVSLQQLTTNATPPAQCTTPYVECALKIGSSGQPNSGNFQAIDWSSIDQTPTSGGTTFYNQNSTYGYQGNIPPPTTTATPIPAGSPYPVYNFQVSTEPGDMGQNTSKDISTLMGWDSQESCTGNPTATPTPASCAGVYVTPTPNPDGSTPVPFYPQSHPAPLPANGVCYQYVQCPRVVVVPFIQQSWNDQTINGKSQPVTVVAFGCFYITRTEGNAGQFQVDGMFIDDCRSEGPANYGVPLSNGSVATNSISVFLWH
ncbi:MAG TPA: pilus assembly protein TadG-related protein [Chloroflexota bacterium]|nr:pilus assembly protein TadG-related protein [Chloroflexota bacterium]